MGVPPVTVTRRNFPGGKCGGSVQVHVMLPPELDGVSPANSFCARQYEPMLTMVSVQTSGSDLAWLMAPVTSVMATGLYQVADVGVIEWMRTMSQWPAVC